MGSNRGLRFASVAVGLVALGLFGPATVSSGQIAAPLTVVKVVAGTAPAGTTFSVTIACTPGTIVAPNNNQITMTFNATGQPQGVNTISFNGPTSCTVTETVTGGASTVQYSCTSSLPSDGTGSSGAFPSQPGIAATTTTTSPATHTQAPPVCPDGPQTAPMTVTVISEVQTATVTITNTFPAAAVVAAPRFTG